MNPLDRLRELLPEFVIAEKIPKSLWPIKEPAICFTMSKGGFTTGHWIANRFINEQMARMLREDFFVKLTILTHEPKPTQPKDERIR
jgi:hypothetical protein